MSSGGEDIILQITSIGHAMEVRAVAPDGLEVAFVAPIDAGEAEVIALGRAKLDYVRRKGGHDGPAKRPGPDGRGGVLA